MRFITFVCTFIAILSATLLAAPEKATSYFALNPMIKIGKEDGNTKNDRHSFLEFNIFRAKYRHSNFGLSGGGSVGFTGNGDFLSFNHYYKRLSLKSSWFFNNQLSAFGEATFSDHIEGANNPVSYFPVGNYQAVGVENETHTLKNGHLLWRSESKLKIGKYDNGNFFSEIVLIKLNHNPSPYFGWAFGLSTGFTAPRNNFSDWHWHITRIAGQFIVKPTKSAGLFVEGSISTIHNNTIQSPYFIRSPYIAIGIKLSDFKIFKS